LISVPVPEESIVVQSRRAWPRLAVRAGLLVAAAGVLWWLVRVVRAGELSPNDLLSNVIGLLGLVLGVVSLQQQRRQAAAKGEDDPARLDQAADTLAETVKAQWGDEAGLRGLRQPERLQLRWVTTDRPVAVPIASVAGGAIPGRVMRLRGSLDQVADLYLALPHQRQRLVVLGEPGAGKTVLALQLTLELLKRRRQGDGPVAVLMGLAAWDPTAEHLHTWLARRLTQDCPALKNPSYGPDAALELVTSGRVLPVLDGLDELPEPLRARAISELERARADQPLIVTCRSQEFERAVAAGGQVLTAAAVVELVPVTAAEAIGFLRAAAGPTAARWDRVAAHLQAHPEGGLAGALSTPLMVALARTIYTLPDRDPGELTDLATAGGRAAVERQLLEGFIPAAYASRPPAPGTVASRLRHPPSPELAGHWLSVLASHLHQQGTRDLAWWRLGDLLPGGTQALLLGLVGGLAGGLAGGLMGWLAPVTVGGGRSLGVGLMSGLGLGLLYWNIRRVRLPARINTQLRGRLKAPLIGLLNGLGLGLGFGLLIGVASGSGLGVGLVAGLGFGLLIGVGFGLVFLLESPGHDVVAVTPDSLLRADRAFSLVMGLAIGLGPGLAAGFGFRLLAGLGLGAAVGIGLVAVLVVGPMFVLLVTAWGWFVLARGWLSLRGRLPPQLMAFLGDAHRRGVLRQEGAVYQFRHARLQDHLAATSPAAHPDHL
jgi:hypothetical protein